jgi:hypothetical protein
MPRIQTGNKSLLHRQFTIWRQLYRGELLGALGPLLIIKAAIQANPQLTSDNFEDVTV